MISFDDPMILAGVILLGVVAFFGLIVAAIVKVMKRRSGGEIFEHQDIEKLIRPEITLLLDYWGNKIEKKLRYRFGDKGVVFRQLDMTQGIEKDGDYNGEADAEVSIDDDELEQSYENGEISERVYKLLDNFKSEPVHILVVRPAGLLNKFKWFVAENILSQDNLVSRIIIVPERLIRDDVDYITIKKEADFRRFAGMDVAVESSAFRFIESIGFKNLYSQALQDQQNYHKQVNFYSARFTQELQKLRAASEIDQKKYGKKNANLVNED